jgi:hypothetical protein
MANQHPITPPSQEPAKPFWEIVDDAWWKKTNMSGSAQSASVLRVIADEVERRGSIDYDRDPGETADWLRAEADKAEKGD